MFGLGDFLLEYLKSGHQNHPCPLNKKKAAHEQEQVFIGPGQFPADPKKVAGKSPVIAGKIDWDKKPVSEESRRKARRSRCRAGKRAKKLGVGLEKVGIEPIHWPENVPANSLKYKVFIGVIFEIKLMRTT